MIDAERAPHVVGAFKAYATGEWNVAQLVAGLKKWGLQTRPAPARPAAVPTVTSFHWVLTDTYYEGVVAMNGVRCL